jgi:hypothetical protein
MNNLYHSLQVRPYIAMSICRDICNVNRNQKFTKTLTNIYNLINK